MQSLTPDQATDERIGTAIAELPTMNRAALLKVWAKFFPAPPPSTLRKELMVPILAYRIQEKEFGGLSHRARQRLKAIAAGLEPRRKGTIPKLADPNPGTRLVRTWRGETHEVVCREGLYLYRGEEYRSLSKIAKTITGTHWSGPAFFGSKGVSK